MIRFPSFLEKTVLVLISTVCWMSFLFFCEEASSCHAHVHPEVRLKDLGRFEGVRSNQLVGMGLVLGLQGTGDKGDIVSAMLGNLVENFGVAMERKDIKSKNAAVVTVICELPAFARNGENIDVTVSAIGDAKSLEGGVLLQTPLKAANGEVYAVAQGPVSTGGFSASSAGSRLSKNVATTGRIPSGAIVEKETDWDIENNGTIRFLLRNPDFTTAERVVAALNGRFGNVCAAADGGCVEIAVPATYQGKIALFIASAEKLKVRPDMAARVVVNERTGTVAMGGDVKISAVAIAHGNLTITVSAEPDVSQPAPFSPGETMVTEQSVITAEEEKGSLAYMEVSTTVDDIVKSLNALGASPRDIIIILQAIDEAGALQGELVIM